MTSKNSEYLRMGLVETSIPIGLSSRPAETGSLVANKKSYPVTLKDIHYEIAHEKVFLSNLSHSYAQDVRIRTLTLRDIPGYITSQHRSAESSLVLLVARADPFSGVSKVVITSTYLHQFNFWRYLGEDAPNSACYTPHPFSKVLSRMHQPPSPNGFHLHVNSAIYSLSERTGVVSDILSGFGIGRYAWIQSLASKWALSP